MDEYEHANRTNGNYMKVLGFYVFRRYVIDIKLLFQNLRFWRDFREPNNYRHPILLEFSKLM